MDMSLSKLWALVMDREASRATVHGGRKESETTELLNWTEQRELEIPEYTCILRPITGRTSENCHWCDFPVIN